MSNGGGENRREIVQPNTYSQRKSGGDDFATAVARMAVAQICEGEGFQSFQQSALDALTDVAVRYIFQIGKTACLYANLAGRSECNAFDVVQGLEDLGSGRGFSGASDVNHCLANSGVILDIIQFVDEVEETPFAYSLPRFSFSKERKLKPSFLQCGEQPPSEHIPPWLPSFPKPQTYEPASGSSEREIVHQLKGSDQLKLNGKIEESSDMRKSFASNGVEGHLPLDCKAASRTKTVLGSNAFLAPPLQSREKEVSSILLPERFLNEVHVEGGDKGDNQVLKSCHTVRKTSGLATEAKESSSCDSGVARRNISLDERPSVKFKFAFNKKPTSTLLGVILENKRSDRSSQWFRGDVEKDDQKNRAEKF